MSSHLYLENKDKRTQKIFEFNLCDRQVVFSHATKENFFSMPRYIMAMKKNLKTSLTIRRTNTRDMHTKTDSEYVKQYTYCIFL